MMRWLYAAGLALAVLMIAPVGATPGFDALLEESGLRLGTDPDLVEVGIQTDSPIPYEYALRHASGALEMRFIVRPLDRIEIEYEDPHNAAPEPNHLFPLLFESLTNTLAEGAGAPSSEFSEAESQQHFNADWAAIAVFDVDPGISGGYSNALLLALHKNDLADAYTLFLYRDYAEAKPLINRSLALLQFDSVASP